MPQAYWLHDSARDRYWAVYVQVRGVGSPDERVELCWAILEARRPSDTCRTWRGTAIGGVIPRTNPLDAAIDRFQPADMQAGGPRTLISLDPGDYYPRMWRPGSPDTGVAFGREY